MVFWGQDVRHQDGNLLTKFGLERRPSSGLQGTSCYSTKWHGGHIELHGAVASWSPPPSETGTIFCRNLGKISLWHHSQAPIPGREHGAAGSFEERWTSLQPLLHWVVKYEEWIEQSYGPTWRHLCWRNLKRLPKGKPWLAPDLALQWWRLAAAGTPPRPRDLLKH
jgi:hypothetical protein